MNKQVVSDMLDKEMQEYQAEATIAHELAMKALKSGNDRQYAIYVRKNTQAWEIVEALAKFQRKVRAVYYDER